MPIQSFSQIPTQPQLNPDAVVTRGAGPGGQLELREPLNPPGRWTQFKAALASVPLLGNLGSLRQARAEVDAYPVKLGQYQATNRQMLAGLHEELRNAYGGEIADMTLRNMGIADGAPLTARTVSTALEGARRAQQSCRSLNNMMATRLLESPLAGGQKLRGEKDMTDVFLDRGLEMRGASSWQEAVGPGAAKFITQQVMQRCAQLPEHARGALANEQVARAMDEALAAYQEIAGAPGMTPDKLQKILGDASTQKTPGAGLVRAREMVLAQSAEVLLDRKNPESFLRQEAGRVAERFGMPPLSDKVLKAIGGSMADQVSQSNYGQVAGQLGLAPDASLETAVPALRARLETNTRQALEGHYEALRMIEDSATLSDPQKAQLRQVATERRLDPEQVRQFERLAGSVGAAARELGRGDASTALGTLQRLMVDMQQAMRAMQDHAGGMWLQNTVSGDAGNKTFEIAAQLAATALPPEQARELLAALTGDGMKQFVQQVASGASGMVREQVTQLVGEMVLAVAARAGLGADEAMAQVRSVTNQPELPRESIPPGRLMDLMRADRNLIDARGVLETAPHGNLVSPDFSAEGVVREQSADFLGHVGRGTVDEA
ncbi:MAG TPA: hypothetical protein VLJ58_07045, partial [Ramlibacter sp.]|nr:hypothetical protein [Ramlibacter sp.]